MGLIGEINAAVSLSEKGWNLFRLFRKNKIKCDDYYYEEYNKKVYIRKNGDGLILCSCRLRVIDPTRTESIVRTLDISDAKISSKFEPFETMLNKPIENMFTEYGFWYISDNDIITDVTEYYEDDDIKRTNDDKFISIKLQFDTAKLQKVKVFDFSYGFSIPGLFPIKDGRFDLDEQDRNVYVKFSSHVSTSHIGHHLRFSVYFEDGIEFKEKPKGHVELSSAVKTKKKKRSTYVCEFKDNIFYKKYHFEVPNPEDYRDIYIEWNTKNPKTIAKKGG